MLETITAGNPERWDEIVRSMYKYDFYHLHTYHCLDQSGEALLLYFHNETAAFAFPVIQRNIHGTAYKDITSVYGYSGPLSQSRNPSEEDVRLFQEELKRYFDANHIVTAFARLHPLLEEQSLLLENWGEVKGLNLTVGIDLTAPEAQQRKQYSRSLRYRVNYLKKQGVTVVKASGKKEIDAFIEIYKENMDRVKAAGIYYFPAGYFYTFLNNIDSCILLASYGNQWISGSLCTFCNGIMQAHLNATKNDFLHLSPLKLVLDRARETGMARGMHCLHLGGGRSGNDDSLFVFKSRFSGDRFLFKVWTYIHDREAYARLVSEKYSGKTPPSDFFPLYRA
ncbi:MAG: GNAT family N-acetyltransferase [Dysgonamonadaceae bacterium]|jgi:hypothetical protein|nr:GNAT family N-acetyltransferase [Dysgonamonadaceae bacterium]